MKTGELEMHVRRVVWRYGKTGEKWRIFGYRTVSFGDKPVGSFLDIVINKLADMFKEIMLMTSLLGGGTYGRSLFQHHRRI